MNIHRPLRQFSTSKCAIVVALYSVNKLMYVGRANYSIFFQKNQQKISPPSKLGLLQIYPLQQAQARGFYFRRVKRRMMAASCALVAVPWGDSVVSVMPWMMPLPTAQAMACLA